MPVLSFLGVGASNVFIIFALFLLVVSGDRVLDNGGDHVSLLQGTDVLVQHAESHSEPLSPAAVSDTSGAVSKVFLKADSAWHIACLIPIVLPLSIITCCITRCLGNYEKLARAAKNAPVSLKRQTAEGLLMNTMDTPGPQSPIISDKPMDISAHICPSVIMPSSETRFAVPLRALSAVGVNDSVDIVDGLGNPVFRAFVSKVVGGRKLVISMAIEGSTPRASICPGVGSEAPLRDEFEIRGPCNSFYGTLQREWDDRYVVKRAGQIVMNIDVERKTSRPRLKVVSVDGKPLASISCKSESAFSVEHLEISARPNADSVLILTCVFAVILLV